MSFIKTQRPAQNGEYACPPTNKNKGKNMKKNMIFTILSIVCLTATADTVDWWNQPTVCKINNTKCYNNITMNAGFDPGIWDATASCRGMKYICPNALIQQEQNPKLISKNDIAKQTNTDYDINTLGETGDCFGKRKTNKTGTQIMVNGDYVNLYCHGILDNADEELANGEIVYKNQPTCETLKEKGYIAVENGKCIGKYIDESKYYIDCGTDLLPKRLVLLNGAEITTKNTGNITTQKDADNVFNTMYSASKKQKTQYFKK
jgi:hypothetical protein